MNFLRHFHNAHAQAYEYNGSVCTISLDLRINRHFQPISKYFRVIGQMLQCYWGVIHHLRGILFGKVAVISYHPPLGMFRSSIHNPCPSKLYNYKMQNIKKHISIHDHYKVGLFGPSINCPCSSKGQNYKSTQTRTKQQAMTYQGLVSSEPD